MKILMVLTSHDQMGDTGHKTGFWLKNSLRRSTYSKTQAPTSPSHPLKAASHRLTRTARLKMH